MEDKRKSLAQLSEFIAANSTQSYENWTHFLRFAGRFYKYSYDEQIGIYLQRPDATAGASYEIWNEKMHRYIKRGAVGIAVLDNSGESVRVRYLFDIADTGTRGNSRTPNIWEMRREHENAIVQDLDRSYGIPDDVGALENHLELLAMQMASAYWEENSAQIVRILDGSGLSVYDTDALGINFRKALSNSVLYLLISRCLGNPDDYLGLEDLSDVADFSTPQAAAALGTAVNTISSEVLRQIERTVRSYDRNQERSNQYEQPTDLHSQRGLSDSEHQTGTHTPDSSEQVRADAPELPEGAESDTVQHPGNAPAAISAPSGDSADRRGAVESDDGGAAGAEPGTGQSAEPDGLGTAHEQPESPGRGSNLPGADLRLIIEDPPFEGEQVSFFASEYEQIQIIDEAERVQAAPSAFSMPQEYIDQFLRYGSNTQNHRMRVAIEYAKQQPQDDLVDFLKKTYHGGYGLQFDSQKVSAWYTEDGMRLTYGSTARYARNAQIVPWRDVSHRIGELLEQGQFATNVELAECGTFEKRQLAEQLLYMSRDIREKAVEAGYMSIVRSLRGGFPEETEKLMNLLSDPQSYQAIMNQVYVFRDACDADKSMMRFQVYNPNKLIRPLEEYTLPRRAYVSELAELPAAKGFITEDEINEHLSDRSSRIYAFYQTPHTAKEKLESLKNEYGISGGNNALSRNFMSDVWTDGKDIRYSKPNCPRIELPWPKVVKYYDALAESGRLIPPKEASQQNQPQEITSDASVEAQPETAEALPEETIEPTPKESAPAEWAYNEIKSAHPDDIVLFQVGDFFEMYGEDARQAAKLLELTLATRPVPGAGRVEMCGIPAHRLEQYVEKLRNQFDVTIAAISETGTERRIFTLRSADHGAETAIEAQEAELGADGTQLFHDPEADLSQPTVQDYLDRYTPVVIAAVLEDTTYRNACGHTDRENAQIECNAAVRRAVLQAKDTELLKPFLDMPEFRSRLHSEVFDGTYTQLHELLRPLSQDDIDDALRRWNGDIASKQAVYRYMSAHGRESDTAVWLEQEFSAEKKPFIVRPGSPESYEMPWAKVQRRIAQLIRTEKFYTEEEQDRLDDIDPIAIRERLAESGIIDGKVVDPERLNNNPFIRMVTEDVRRISDEKFAEEHLIPGESTFEIDGRTFLVDRVNLDSCSVNFQDITFSNATGFPIFRTESIAFVRKYVEEQEKQSVQPETSAETVAVYSGEKNNLPYDVVVQTLRTEGTPPPVQNTPVSIPIDEKWQEFPSVADAEQASYEEYKENLRRNARNFRITDDDLGTGGPKAKFQANMAAIRLLKNLEQEGLQASPEQQEILSRYVGWGGLADAFEESKPTWSGEFAELRSTLTPEEYTAARASTLNAHYTTPTVIRAIYEAVGNMGFQTGNILEPSMGVGNFFGMLPEEMQSSRLYGVELDSITGRIAGQLYPKANITVAGFETTDRRDFFDLAIGNVPFGQYKVNDPAYNKLGFNIHNYFFAKALDQVRPGGVVAFVTSRYTMDAQNPNVRKYLAQRAELLGAIRLPNTAFKANAGTEVVSDILFLQKRERALDLEPEWVHLGQTEDGFAINSYFLEHPEMVMGKNSSESTAHGIDYTVEPLEDVSLAQQLHEAVQHIQGSYLEAELPDLGDGNVIQDTIPADPDVKNYSYALVDGEVYFRENSVMVRPALSNVAKERVKGMIGLRDCVRALIELQMDYLTPDADIREKQADLNSLYDGFSKKYGLINSKGNRMAFSDDSSYYLLCSLEVLDEDNKFLRKADMFTKRTIRQARAVTSVDTASEALAVSIAEHACVDMDYMSQLSGKSAADLAAELRGVIFQVPDFSENSIPHYVTADEYLSGNVRKKLAQARQAAQKDAVFQDNVAALEKAQPKDLAASEIDVRLGATWIDKKYIQEFMEELLQPPIYLRQSIQVNYSSYTAEWNITGKKNISFRDVNANTTYGTSRINAYQILQESLNLRDVRVYDTVIDENKNERRVLNQKETTLAQQKQQAIKDAFREWIWKDPQRRQTLVQLYNERYNSDRPREYDGSHINFGGMSPEITLREHQRNAIAHILYGGNTLLAHEVGSGKTFEMVAAAMESRRLGLCSKSMIVVPNHLIEQWASEFLRLYPSANLLVARKKDFEPANRKTFCSKIATGEYDAVIIGHSQFEKIPMSLERQQAVIEQQIAEIEEGIEELKASGAERFTVKSMERTRKSLSARLEKLMDGGRKDDVVCFEQLGVDRLFVDEAHGYKNLFLYTKMQNVAGISTTDAQKSSDMYMKCQYLDEKTGGRGVIFATGTPISNSMTELYTMMRYLQSDTLREKGWSHFDCWAAHFGETKTVIELAPEGTGYRARTRFAKFYNLPELINIWKEAADVKTADQLNLPRPEAIYHNEVAKPTQTQKELVQELSQRAAAVHSSRVDSKDDNMLKITSDGRKLGLDQRIINPYLPDEPGTKVNLCVDNVLRIWREGAADKLTQLIFCDISTPKSQAPVRKTLPEQSDFPSTQSTDPLAALNSSDSSFTVYDDIRGKLIAGGIPEEQIAFIHEANTEARKKELFAKVRTGQVRVLMGSTFKMGAGMNVQDRLIALHDLDCPWRPGDLEQRSGRIIRQGNRNKQVHIYRYVTEGTFDSYLWQTVENKQKFISQIMTSKSPVRSCDDVDETALSFAEIKALCAGNPQIKEKMDLDIEVFRLKVLKADHLSQQFRMEDNLLKYFPEQIQKLQSIITGLEADIHLAESHPHPEDGISPMVIDGNALSDKEAAGIALLDAVKKAIGLEPVSIGTYRGFHITATLENFGKDRILTLSSAFSHQVTLGNDARGNLIRIDNALRELPQQLITSKNQLENLQSQMEFTKAELGKPFPQEAELAQKSQRLAELNALLDMDGKQTTEQDESKAAPDERPSVLEDLHRRSASIPPHKHSDSRSLEERT